MQFQLGLTPGGALQPFHFVARSLQPTVDLTGPRIVAAKDGEPPDDLLRLVDGPGQLGEPPDLVLCSPLYLCSTQRQAPRLKQPSYAQLLSGLLAISPVRSRNRVTFVRYAGY